MASQKIVRKKQTKTSAFEIIGDSEDADKAFEIAESAHNEKNAPYLVEIGNFQTIKKLFGDKPSEQELKLAKARDEKEKKAQESLKKPRQKAKAEAKAKADDKPKAKNT